MAANKYTLPTSTNARDLVATPLDRATAPASSKEPKVKNTLELELPKDVATLRSDNSKFLEELSQMDRPIDRMQNLISSCSQRTQRSVNNMTPTSEYVQNVSTRIGTNIQQAIRISTNIGSSSVVRQLDEKNATARVFSRNRSFAPSVSSYTSAISDIPGTLNNIADNAISTAKNAVMSVANAAMNFASSIIGMIGSVINFIMSLIGGFCASAFQMERTCLAKMDTRPPEFIQVVEKGLNGMMSIKPPTQTEWPTKKIEAGLKSLVALISKFNGGAGCSGGAGLSSLASLGSQCAGAVNTCMGIANQVDALFGKGTCCGMPAYKNLCASSSLGDIGNPSDYLKNTFTQLASPISETITLPKINSEGFTGTISKGEGRVNLGNNQQATSTNIVDPTVEAGGFGNITGTGSVSTGEDISGGGSDSVPSNQVLQATINKGTVTNGVISAGKIDLSDNGGDVSGGTLLSPEGLVLNYTVWGSISSSDIADSISGLVVGNNSSKPSIDATIPGVGGSGSSDNNISLPFNTPLLNDLYGGEIIGGKIEDATISIIGLEEEPVNLTGCTVTVYNYSSGASQGNTIPDTSNDNTLIVDENYNQIKILPNEISYNNVITPLAPTVKIILVSGSITEVYVTNIFISSENNGDCGSRVISGTEVLEISSNPLQHTVQQMVQTNRQGLVLETVLNGDDSKKAADNAKNDIINFALEETLNPELQSLVTALVENGRTNLSNMNDMLQVLKEDIKNSYADTLATLETKDPDPYANVIMDVLNQTNQLTGTVDALLDDLQDVEDNMLRNTNKLITNNMNILLDSIDVVKNEIDDNIDDQLKDIDIIFKALDREAQLIDQIQPNVSDKTKDDSCTLEYRTYV